MCNINGELTWKENMETMKKTTVTSKEKGKPEGLNGQA